MILITGATGHIGNVLVQALSRHYPDETLRILIQPHEKLDMFDRMSLELYYGDIRKIDDVRAAVRGSRLVFHLAGMIDTSPHPGPHLAEINVGGTQNVITACEEESRNVISKSEVESRSVISTSEMGQVVRLIYVSSVHALPDLPNDQMISEIEEFPVPGLPDGYARTKSEATGLVYQAIRRGLDAVVAFPSGVIGPDDYQLSEMGRLFRYFNSIRSLRLVLSFNGAYNFVDVRDVVEGLIAIAERGRSGQGYILSGHRITVGEIIRLERQVLGQRQPLILSVPVWIVKSGSFILSGLARILHLHSLITPYSIRVLQSNSRISHEKASRELGFTPRPILDTFRDSLAWMVESGAIRHPSK